MDKKKALEILRKNPQKHWKVQMFEQGYKRKQCPKCGKYFWTKGDQELCGDSTCVDYNFIGNSPTKESWTYHETWQHIKKFFEKNGHETINRYPVICRWFSGLHFTNASIVDFQRKVSNKSVFEFPSDPLIVPQVCLRFNDILNIGVSGEHFSSFIMLGQHGTKANGYWKDEASELDRQLLTKEFGVNEEKITWVEDVWAGYNAFGPSLEYFVDGVELGNIVFTSYNADSSGNFTEMSDKVIDMGAGFERMVWLTQGTPTAYDAVFGDVITDLKKETGLQYDQELFTRFSKLAGSLDADEVDQEQAKKQVAKKLGVSPRKLSEELEKLKALYSVCDHARTILFAVTDGGIPSNAGGGYNLRVILRRAFDLIDDQDLDIDFYDVCMDHARELEPMFPELKENPEELEDILKIEKEKYRTTLKKARRTVKTLLDQDQEFTKEKMAELYESRGITPELVKDIASKRGKEVNIPQDFYTELTSKHVQEQEKETDLPDLPSTDPIYYSNGKQFTAEVLENIEIEGKNWVVLDRTGFYPSSGGQDHDTGTLNGQEVTEVIKEGKTILHQTKKLSEGQEVKGKIDWNRRQALTKHHTATHIINGAARRVLGDHVWQAGAEKVEEKGRLDITHYKRLTDEQKHEIQDLANQVIEEDRKVLKTFMSRQQAEELYGFRLYQGGAVPKKEIRVVNIPGFDVEACGGTHADRTSELEQIVLLRTEKIQDGIIRIEFAASEAAEKVLEERKQELEKSAELLNVPEEQVPQRAGELLKEFKQKRKELEKLREKHADKELETKEFNGIKTSQKVFKNVDMKYLRQVSKEKGSSEKVLVLAGNNENKTIVFAAVGKKTREKKANAEELVQKICSELNGGGGGSAAKAEGGTAPASEQEIKEAIKNALEETL